MTEAEKALLALYARRRMRAEAKKRFQEKCADWDHQQCSGGPSAPEIGPCYLNPRLDFEEWCDMCRDKHPLWEEVQRCSAKCGGALRHAVHIGKKIYEREIGEWMP